MFSVSTCLSEPVYRLVCVEGVNIEGHQSVCVLGNHTKLNHLTEEGLLDWAAIKELVSDVEDADYISTVRRLSRVFITVKEFMEKMTVIEFESRYSKYLEWTSFEHEIFQSFQVLKGESASSVLLTLLMSTSMVERALGDLYLLQGKQCPSLLKDLLVTDELRNILGPFVVEFLRALMGPPVSLNLRNLVWHGFPAPGEIHIQYGYMMIMVIVILGHIISTTMTKTSIPHRPLISLNKTDLIYKHFTVDIKLPSTADFSVICSQSDFILPQFRQVWADALDLVNDKRYGESVCLLFPLIENGLRLMFAHINDSPHRVLTAQSSVLYTTFDEILALNLPDNSSNKLFLHIGQPLCDLLLDLMVLPEGPRFRDRLGHGEVRISDITETQATVVWFTACSLICKFTSLPSQHDKNVTLDTVLSDVEKYQSVFHPVSLLICKLEDFSERMGSWLDKLHYTPCLDKINPDDVQWLEIWMDNAEYCQMLEKSKEVLLHFQSKHLPYMKEFELGYFYPEFPVTMFVNSLSETDRISYLRSTLLYGNQSTPKTSASSDTQDGCSMQVVFLLRKVVSECEKISDNIIQALSVKQQLYESQELRSRQRETFKRLLSSFPCVSIGIRVVIMVIVFQLLSVDGHLSIRFLKSMLQYCENLRTYTSMEKNKWSESTELSIKFLDRLCGAFR